MTFVGRTAELALLRSRLSETAGEGLRLVLLEGAPACGKTALLRHFTSTLTMGRVVWATGDEEETGVVLGFLEHLTAQLAVDRVPPREGPQPGGEPPAGHREAPGAGVQLMNTLARASRNAPLVVVLDDVDLADTPSLTALTYAVRRIHPCPVLMVLTVCSGRPNRLGPGLTRMVDVHGSRLSLGGVSTSDVQGIAELTGLGRVTRRAAERLRLHAGDNMLYLCTLMSELSASDINNLQDPLPAPRSFASMVQAKWAALDDCTRRLAAAAAVLGVECSVSHAAQLAGLDAPLPAVQGVCDAGFARLSVGVRGAVLTFAHPIVRAAIHDGLGPVTRCELHGRAAALCSGIEALKHRAAACVSPDSRLAEELINCAATAAERGAWHQAATLLAGAARLSPSDAVRDGLIVDALDLLLRDGDLVTAAPYVRVTDAMPASAHLLQVRARLAWLQGRYGAAESLARAAWDRRDDLSFEGRDLLAATLAQMCIMRGDGTSAADWSAEALRAGSLHPEVAAATQATAAIGLVMTGRGAQATESLAQLAAQSAGSVHPVIHAARGMVALWTGDLDGALTDLEAGRSTTGNATEPYELVALGYLVDAEYRSGNWDRAGDLAHQLVELVEDSGQSWLRAFSHAMASLVPSARGRWESAAHHVEWAALAAAELGDQPSRATAANAAVHLAACRGEPAAVVAAAQWLIHEPGAHHEPGFFSWPVEYAAALVQLGRLDDAEAWLSRLRAVGNERGHRPLLAAAARVQGELACVRRDTVTARAAFEAAVHGVGGTGRGLEVARAHAAYGRFLRRRGERRSAIDHLVLARETFSSLGAVPFLQAAERELQACGSDHRDIGHGADDGLHVARLTSQELIVAELVSTGRTNRQVAEELVLSVKTVDYHLRHVYQKLGVRTRTQLVGRLSAVSDRSETQDLP